MKKQIQLKSFWPIRENEEDQNSQSEHEENTHSES